MSLTLKDLPANWGSRDQVEKLTPAAADSLSRVMMRAVAETNTYFNINDAYRSKAEQIALFKANYSNTGRRSKSKSTDRWYAGTVWARKSGSVAVASPDLYGTGTGANHTRGLAIDVVPAAIQNYLKTKGLASGWSWAEGKKNGEAWHFVYIESKDRYRNEGPLDHAAVQRIVGAKVDGKIGPATAAKIREWQKKNGLTADGKVGLATKRAMGLSGKGKADPAPATPTGGASAPTELVIEQAGPAKNAYDGRTFEGVDYEIKHVTIHWWGKPSGQTFEGIRDYLIDNARSVSAHYVVSGPRVAQILPEERGAWGNGNRRANLEGIVIECDPNRVKETIPTLVALLADIFRRRGDLDVYPHDHWTSTECPGEYRQHIPEIVAAAKSGKPIIIKETTPSAAGGLPTGKDLLMKLADVPDFPLLRTAEHRCYYGDVSGPIESVSGKSKNSLNPGDIYTRGGLTRSRGIETAQRRLNERGYSVDVDGRWGGQMDNAIDNIQRLAGFTRDKKLGPMTWYALWLLPVK